MAKPPRDYLQQCRDVRACIPGTPEEIVKRSGWCLRIVRESLRQMIATGEVKRTVRKYDGACVYRVVRRK